MRLLSVVLAGMLLITPACATAQTAVRKDRPASPPTPVPVKDILYAQPFTVDRPFINTWSMGRPRVSSGVFVVVEIDPAYADPRDSVLNPVLYAGNVAVIPLNRGSQSGRIIGIIPGNIDLTTSPIWFGAPELASRITPAIVEAERARAEKAGIRPFPAGKIAAVRQPPTRSTSVAALLRTVVADLVLRFSPQEKALADKWRLPEARAPYQRPN